MKIFVKLCTEMKEGDYIICIHENSCIYVTVNGAKSRDLNIDN